MAISDWKQTQEVASCIGIVTMPYNLHFDANVVDEFAQWIRQWNVSSMTGNFGSGNDSFIARTAVAANASVDHTYKKYSIN